MSDEEALRRLALLEWFVIRARRVEEHSLASDRKQLAAWASGTLVVSGTEGQPPSSVRWRLPPEEQLDSLAARCRPFVLSGDPVYWAKVTGALGYFLRNCGDEQLASYLQEFRASWRKFDKGFPGSLGYHARAGRNRTDLSDLVDGRVHAYAWLYGDLVHADLPDRLDEHDIDDRYRAGAILISNIAVCVIATLNLVRIMQERGIVNISPEIFRQRVKANPDAEFMISQIVAGPAGTSAEDLDAAPSTSTIAEPDCDDESEEPSPDGS